MKTTTLLTAAIILTMSMPVYAQMDNMDHNHAGHEGMPMDNTESVVMANQPGDALVSVNGLVCDFCARALEKTFGKREEVKGINVDLESKIVTVNFTEGQSLDNETLRQIITDSGYNVEGISRVE